MSENVSFFTENECIIIEKVIIQKLNNENEKAKQVDKEVARDTGDGSDVNFMIEYSWKNSL